MGTGLDLDPSGLNVVFVGGTGILVVLDIVARLAIKLCNGAQNSSGLGQDFKLLMYFTAPTTEQALGLSLMQKVEQLAQKLGSDTFCLFPRISDYTAINSAESKP